VLAILKSDGATLAELVAEMPKYPQLLINVPIERKVDLEAPAVAAAVAASESRLGDSGRVVLRASGTEPVIRVMVEGRDEAQVQSEAEAIAAAVRGEAARKDVP
jgi:phosphoglucosamine mutase